MMIIRMTAASLPGTSGRPLDIAALISWLLTAGIGSYMVHTWIARGGLRRQRTTGVGVPPPVVFGHAGAAISGLAVWAGYVSSGWRPLAWLGVVLVGTAITLGICTVTLWTPYPVQSQQAQAGDTRAAGIWGERLPSAGGSAGARGVWGGGQPPHEQRGPGGNGGAGSPPTSRNAGDRPPDDTDFTVTDEMIASLLTGPSPARPWATSLVPLIPVVHGFAAITTFMLVVLTAALTG